jgi:hypothetical protein
MKLKEANRQRTFIAAIKDLDFWLGEVESLLNTDDHGKDLASVQNLMKKHQLVEADIMSHEDRIKDMNEQVSERKFLFSCCCRLCLLISDTRQHEAARCGIFFNVGSYTQTINVKGSVSFMDRRRSARPLR